MNNETPVMNIRKKIYALVCQNDDDPMGPIIMESYIDDSDYHAAQKRAAAISSRWGRCWMVELPMSILNGAIIVNSGCENKVRER